MGTLKILPLLIIVALFSFMVRVGDIVTEVKTIDQALSVSATAEDKKEEEKPAEGEKKTESVEVPKGLPENETAALPKDKWADPTTLDLEFSETQTSVLKELKDRRENLDKREQQIQQREALLLVAEKRIEEKYAELSSIKSEIETLLGKQSEEEEARLQSLVKIYSGMKPKEAAEIFDNLDMDILLQVVSRMSERKSAPIFAGMSSEKARELTTLLAEQKKLPDVPDTAE